MEKYGLSLIGAGYVGLSTAVAYANRGYHVLVVDLDAQKAEMINKGIPILYEPRLRKSLQEALRKNLLRCTLNKEEAILRSDITFVAVDTPSKPDGGIDLDQIEKSAGDIGAILKKKKTYHLVVVKSTVIPGTTENIVKPILEEYSDKQCGIDFGLCMNPEFLRQGAAIHDTLNPDRIVIGESDQKSGDTLEVFFQDFYGGKLPPIIRTNLATAELIKYASNAFLAAKISFINTIGSICEKTPKVDVKKIAEAMGLDKRICPAFLNAGLGYGGSCFPKDIKALIAYSHNIGYNPQLLEIIEKVNNDQPSKVVEVCKSFLGSLNNKRIALLGLAFKPETDDIREARSFLIINQLLAEDAKVIVYDPAAVPNAKTIFKEKIEYADSSTECLKDADCCILVTEWAEFKKLEPENFTAIMKQPILIDGRRIYDPEKFSSKMKFAAIGLAKNNQNAPRAGGSWTS